MTRLWVYPYRMDSPTWEAFNAMDGGMQLSRIKSMQIENNVFLVTGGASGLGGATAEMLIKAGAKVVLADIDHKAGARAVIRLGENAHFVQTDVSSEVSAKQAFSVAQRLGALSGLINCAGIAPAAKVTGKEGVHSLDLFARTIAINLVGTFNMIRLAAEAMASNIPNEHGERGVIINTASVAAYEGQLGQAAYAASKGGVVAMTLPITRELARMGVRVMTIAPGIMETPMLLSMPSEVRESLGKMVPFPSRLGTSHEYAALAQHILSNPYLNGEVIRLDGAIRMAAK